MNPEKIKKLLKQTNLPEDLYPDALTCLLKADKDSDGLAWAKWKVRLFKSGKIANMLTWESERLVDTHPELIDWDIAPVINVTCYGDNMPWNEETGLPKSGQWLNQDPNSEEYYQAVKSNYWCEGEHPRSYKSHKAQYRRNAGEGRAWRLGIAVDASTKPDKWEGNGVTVYRWGNAWQLISFKPLINRLGLNIDIGYEIANVWNFKSNAQGHYPIEGYELRAPLTYSILPGFKEKG